MYIDIMTVVIISITECLFNSLVSDSLVGAYARACVRGHSALCKLTYPCAIQSPLSLTLPELNNKPQSPRTRRTYSQTGFRV